MNEEKIYRVRMYNTTLNVLNDFLDFSLDLDQPIYMIILTPESMVVSLKFPEL